MSSAQLRKHHKDARHYKCRDATCPATFHKLTHMFQHFKNSHDREIYNQGLLQHLQQRLQFCNARINLHVFGIFTHGPKRTILEKKIALLTGQTAIKVFTYLFC